MSDLPNAGLIHHVHKSGVKREEESDTMKLLPHVLMQLNLLTPYCQSHTLILTLINGDTHTLYHSYVYMFLTEWRTLAVGLVVAVMLLIALVLFIR